MSGVLFIFLYIFIGICSIQFIIFSILFILQKLALKKEYKLKMKFNYFNDNPIASNLKSINFLAENNKELKELLNYFIKINKIHKDQMSVIKNQIMEISKYQKYFHLISIWKYLKIIEKNINILKEEEAAFRILNIDTYSYSENSNNIAITLSEIFSDLQIFLRNKNIIMKYSDVTRSIDKLDEEITKTNIKINDKLLFINSIDLHQSFISQLLLIEQLHQISCYFYYIYRYDILAKTLLNELGSLLDSNELEISKSKKIAIELNFNKYKKNIESVIELISKDKLKESKMILNEGIIFLENEKIKINSENLYRKLLSNIFGDFKKIIKIFCDNVENFNLKDIYMKIADDLFSDNQINILVTDSINDIQMIYDHIQNLKQKLKERNIESDDTIRNIIVTYNYILKFIEENEGLHLLLVEKSNQLFSLINKVSQCEINLKQLILFCNRYNVNSTELVSDLESNLKIINEIKSKNLNENKLIDSKLILYITQIENFINQAHKEILDDYILLELSKRLTIYFNRYYNNIELVPSLKQSYKLYNEGNYQECINSYINISAKLKKIKKVANNAV